MKTERQEVDFNDVGISYYVPINVPVIFRLESEVRGPKETKPKRANHAGASKAQSVGGPCCVFLGANLRNYHELRMAMCTYITKVRHVRVAIALCTAVQRTPTAVL